MTLGFLESLPPFVKALPETKQFDYIVNQLKWLEENAEDNDGYQRLRKAAVETVMRYSVEESPFYNDERLLYVFCIVGKLSRTMGMKAVMEELYNRKQFYELAEFYVKWGEIYAEEKNRDRFNQIWNKAVNAGAKPVSRVDEAFRAMLYQHFEMDDEMTVNLFKKPDSSKGLPVALGKAEPAPAQQKAVERNERQLAVKHVMIIADEEQSVEERLAQQRDYAVYSSTLQRPSNGMSVSKLSVISEERSGCASGSSMNPSHITESLVKQTHQSAGDAAGNPILPPMGTTSVATENVIQTEADAVTDKPSECPQSSHLTLHGTSFTERFLSKAMRDFSSTVPVPPPRSVHHEAEETTVLQDTALSDTEHTEFPSAAKRTKFEVYVEGNTAQLQQKPVKPLVPFNVYSDENAEPFSLIAEGRKSTEQNLINERNTDNDNDGCETQSTFKKPAKICHARRSFGKDGIPPERSDNERVVTAKTQECKDKHLSLPDRNDEETLAGLNKKAKAGRMTSTPANGFAPPIEDPIEESSHSLPSSAAEQFSQKQDFDEAVYANTAFGRRMSKQRRATLTKLSEKIGIENIVGSAVLGLAAEGNINEELRRLSLAPNEDDMDEPTGEGLKSHIESKINPWDEKLQEKIMNERRFCPTNLHDFSEKCSRFTPGVTIVLGGERFDIESLIGEGGFAKVYKAKSEDGNTYAVKFQIPPCKWEVFICEALRGRMPKAMLNGVMNVRDGYLFSNASAIVYEYHIHGNLLDMVNNLKAKKMSCSGLLTVYLAWEMGRILEAVHNAHIIHADVKPDNFMILHRLNEGATAEQIVDKKSFTLKLIDWGRSIDMASLKGCTFQGKAGTVAFDCFEMQDGRPWTYQTDFFGFASTLHVIIYGEYMKTFRNTVGRYNMTSVMKRRWQQKDLLRDIFDMCMNIPDCESLPKWSTIVEGLENNIKYCVVEDRMVWKEAAREFNAGIAA